MKILNRKLRTVDSGLFIKDSANANTKILYGYYVKDNITDGTWSENDIKYNINKFLGGDWGRVPVKVAELNNKHLKEEKGNLTGVYPKNKIPTDDMVIFYSERNDCIYVLTRFEFENVEESWLAGDEKYEEEFDPRSSRIITEEGKEVFKKIPLKYGEHGHQLKPEQKELLREIYPNKAALRLPEDLQKRYNKLVNISKKRDLTEEEVSVLNKIKNEITKLELENDKRSVQSEGLHYAGTVHQSEIEATKNAIETGKTSRGLETGLPADAKQVLEGLAKKYNVDYIDLIEKIAEITQIEHKNLKNSYEYVLENINYPYFFADSKKTHDSWYDLVDVIDDIVYSKEWPISVDDVAKSLLKYGVKDLDKARFFVNKYIEENPNELKHFKDSKDENIEIMEQGSERTISKDEPQYKNFEKAAELMTKLSPKGYKYFVKDVYLDAGLDWLWTTVCNEDYQALSPRNYIDLFNAKSDEDIKAVVDRYFKSEFNPDRIEE